MDTTLIERFYNLHISKILSKIKFDSLGMKIKGISEATKIFILTDSKKNENISQSAGKNQFFS
jgi:hypothetical protein